MPLVLPRRSLNLDFVRDGQASGDNYTTELSKLDGLLTFSRSTTATRFNSAGTLETVAAGQPRFDFDPATLACKGLLIEEARTNLVLNSATLATQGVTVTAQAYTLSFWGTGSVALSGAFTGNLAGTGASNRVTLTFTPAAGTLTLTVTGSVTNAQMEAGSFTTSYIPTTSAAVTRAAEALSVASLSPWYNKSGGTFLAEWERSHKGGYQSLASLSAAKYLGYQEPNSDAVIIILDGASGTYNAVALGLGINRFALAWSGTISLKAAGNGAAVQSYSAAALNMNLAGPFKIGANSSGGEMLNGHLRRFVFMPYAVSDTLLKALTT